MKIGTRPKPKGTLSALLAGALFVSLSMNVSGADALTEVKVFLNTGIKVMLNGKSFEPADPDDGTRLVPITYRGSTYLPLRAVAEATGMQVAWDDKTNTAYLGEVVGQVAQGETSYIKLTPDFVYNGNTIYRLSSRTPEELKPSDQVSFGHGYVTGGYRSVTMEVKNDFKNGKFKASIWVQDSNQADNLIIKLFDENQVTVKEMKVKSGTLNELEADIKDVKTLWVTVQGDKSIVGEPMLGN
ncbi:hypothetical protein FE784_30415 [Paenibacillus hemerocallicola]|uniref:Copper amine oxidase-like N-terminal domain-containing protein n=1 Tax=Paenibacillus hemerocallicola TaxID=1172614 RepID=A0A5C4T0H6_9BACL|nr:stalk domain-containing protein [Paenibacillus hemerocallicola]TNJ62483.1 hypothetical protein FE784_30415 [Paenibacillus hemerocallicola]